MSERWRRASSISVSGRLREETVRRDLERRLRLVEITDAGWGIQIWIDQGDGTVRGPHGEQMTREEAEALARAAGTFLFVISETDARL